MKRLSKFDVYDIVVGEIYVDESFNCRGSFSPQTVDELAASIKENGLQCPVVVQPYDKPGFKYRLLAGHRRYKAVTLFLKWKKIPATLRTDLTEHQSKIFNLTENLERKNLNMLEEAMSLNAIYPDGVTLRKAAKELQRPTRWVHTRLRLLDLPEEVQKWAAVGLISAVNIEMLSKLNGPEAQFKAAKAITGFKKEHGKTRAFVTRPDLGRSFKRRKSKQEISDMIIHLTDVCCDGFTTLLLAWVAGRLPDDEIVKAIKNEPGYQQPNENYRPPFQPSVDFKTEN